MSDGPGELGGITSYSRITQSWPGIGHKAEGLQRKGQYSAKYKSGANTVDRDHSE